MALAYLDQTDLWNAVVHLHDGLYDVQTTAEPRGFDVHLVLLAEGPQGAASVSAQVPIQLVYLYG